MSKRVSFGLTASSSRKHIPAASSKTGSVPRRSKRRCTVSDAQISHLPLFLSAYWEGGCLIPDSPSNMQGSDETTHEPPQSIHSILRRKSKVSLYKTPVRRSLEWLTTLWKLWPALNQGASSGVIERHGSSSSSRSSNTPTYKEIPQIIITEQSKQRTTRCNTNRPSGKYKPVVILESLSQPPSRSGWEFGLPIQTVRETQSSGRNPCCSQVRISLLRMKPLFLDLSLHLQPPLSQMRESPFK